jgi:hypothetical protein
MKRRDTYRADQIGLARATIDEPLTIGPRSRPSIFMTIRKAPRFFGRA